MSFLFSDKHFMVAKIAGWRSLPFYSVLGYSADPAFFKRALEISSNRKPENDFPSRFGGLATAQPLVFARIVVNLAIFQFYRM
jgi:hypothetical protein